MEITVFRNLHVVNVQKVKSAKNANFAAAF